MFIKILLLHTCYHNKLVANMCCHHKKSVYSQTNENSQSSIYQYASNTERIKLIMDYGTTPSGLTTQRHNDLLITNGYNIVSNKPRCEALKHFIGSCINTFNILLITLSIVTYIAGDDIGASIILGMIILAVVTGFIQERRSNNAVEKLQRQVSATSIVYRLVSKEENKENIDAERVCDVEI